MALTTLDPNTALLVVDLQKGIVGLPVIHPIAEIVDRRTRCWPPFVRAGCPSS